MWANIIVNQGPVHTNPFSNENVVVLLRIRLSSTLQRRKRSPKTKPFENALQSGAIWKRCFLKTLFSSVVGENDAIWKRRRHQIDTTGRQTTRPWVSKMADRRYHVDFAPISRAELYWNAHASSSFEHAHWGYKSVFKSGVVVWRAKRYENDKCGRKSFWKRRKQLRFRLKTD